MKQKRLKLSAILFLVLGLTNIQAQTMYVKQSSGTQTAYSLSSVRKMTFSTGNLTITKSDNSSGIYTLSGLRYLNFIDLTTHIKEINTTEKRNPSIYPNPVSDLLYIDIPDRVSQNGTVQFINIEGRIIKTQILKGTGVVSVDISQLPQGIYLCRYRNGQEVKTVKIVKQ